MKADRRTVLFSTIGIIAAVAIMVGAGFAIAQRVRGNVSMVRVQAPAMQGVSAEGRITMALEEIDSIYLAGGWSVEVRQGSSSSVEVTANENAIEAVEVYQRGGTLYLELESGIRSITGDLSATVVLSDLERIEANGGSGIRISGFDLDLLEIEVDGAASVTATDGSIDELDIDSDGAASFDFSGVDVTNAEVEMDGASSLNVNMDGGELMGVLRGVGDVTFSGDVSDERVRIEGLGRVRRK